MKNGLKLVLWAVFFSLIFVRVISAGPSGTQTLNYSLGTIDSISVSGDPAQLVINTATPGQDPNDDTDATTTYSISTNGTSKIITGQITVGGDLPAGLTLKILLDATGVGTSAGIQTLSTTAVNLVTGITKLKATAKLITYTLQATTDADPQSGNRTVTLTVSS